MPNKVAPFISLRHNLGIKTTELDNLMAETAAYLNILHPDYGKLAARVAVTKLHKETSDLFMDSINLLFNYTESSGECAALISEEVYKVVVEHKDKL
jgi:ribonucleoside-diphosphate reductase subunit M1